MSLLSLKVFVKKNPNKEEYRKYFFYDYKTGVSFIYLKEENDFHKMYLKPNEGCYLDETTIDSFNEKYGFVPAYGIIISDAINYHHSALKDYENIYLPNVFIKDMEQILSIRDFIVIDDPDTGSLMHRIKNLIGLIQKKII